MKKRFLALVLVGVVVTTSVFAFGIGIQGGVAPGYSTGGVAALTFKPNKVPFVFALDVGFGSTWLNFGITADWWASNPSILGSWKWFWGLGLAGFIVTSNNSYSAFGFGPRLFLGTNFIIAKFLELYLQAAWQPMIKFYSDSSFSGIGGLANFPLNFGIRFWF